MRRIYLIALGSITLILGVIYTVAPQVLTDPTGFGDLAPEAFTDLRATYGGLQIALGLFVLWSAQSPARHRTGLLLLAIAMPSLAVTRATGLLIDREPTFFMVGALTGEILLTIVSWILLRRTPESE